MYGIFSLLDDECKLKQPQLNNFIRRVNLMSKKSTHSTSVVINHQSDFVINHFSCNVQYSSVRNIVMKHIH